MERFIYEQVLLPRAMNKTHPIKILSIDKLIEELKKLEGLYHYLLWMWFNKKR